ncbi:hypothetical protein M513_13107 [Trichuris suis]|uniref:Uncharacterized protein n=1 Tax=Trichuris suis TaxID=68888 RepID=A0A085LM28_9BILA|nr:hypothetical protein M513_13107 [Trichuris suis]
MGNHLMANVVVDLPKKMVLTVQSTMRANDLPSWARDCERRWVSAAPSQVDFCQSSASGDSPLVVELKVVKERFFVSFLDYRKDVIHVTFEKFDAAREVVAREGSLFKVFHEEFG